MLDTTERDKRPELAWDLEITSENKLLDIKVKDLWRYRDLLVLLIRRDFVAQYKQTILGPLWHFIQPLLTTMMFVVIFSKIANIPTDGTHPILFYLSGVTLWNYFSICLTSTSNTFLANAAIFGKVYFPRLIIPLAVVTSNMVRFLIQLLLLFLAMIYFHYNGYPIDLSAKWILIPLLLVLTAAIGLGLGIIISSLTTKYRDFIVLLGFAVQLGMYATPIVYPLSYVTNSTYKTAILLNPLTSIVEGFRYALFNVGSLNYNYLLYSVAFTIVILFIGIASFSKVERTFMDTI